MLTAWTASKSDAPPGNCKLLFLHAAIPLPTAFHYFSMPFVHTCACISVCVCVCTPPVLSVMKGLVCPSQSQVISPHKRFDCRRNVMTHAHWDATRKTTLCRTPATRCPVCPESDEDSVYTHTYTHTLPWRPVVHPFKSFPLSSAGWDYSGTSEDALGILICS